MAVSRQHPFFSRVGCLGGATLIAGIIVAVIFSGGAIFSPGTLTAWAAKGTSLKGFTAHADFQNDCRQCHAPLRGIAPERCESCHSDVGAERAAGAGLHGKLKSEAAARCESCHLDHKGRDLDPNAHALMKFDHNVIGFSLARHITNYDRSPLECKACHTGSDYQFDPATCSNCHETHDASFGSKHLEAFGGKCLMCHDGVDRAKNFDHAQVKFALEGKHANLDCAACHKADVAPADTPMPCVDCHKEPQAHTGVFSTDCAACHTPAGWTPAKLDEKAKFDHAGTGFQLVNHIKNYDDTPFTCRTCHTGEKFTFTAQTCTDCHSAHDATFMTKHLQDYGPNCMSCHDGAGNMKNFDHNQVFVLDGHHAALTCTACHVDQLFRGTPKECAACHTEPEVHAGLFGADCVACHTTTAWAPAQLTRHTFPLDHGGQGEIACSVCHTNSYVAYTCYGCHDHDPTETQRQHVKLKITGDRLNNCAACHAVGKKKEGDN